MKRALRVLYAGLQGYARNNGRMLSAALSFFFIISFIPLCLFLMTLLGAALGDNQELFRFIKERLFGLFPRATSGITSELKKLVAFKGIGLASLALYAIVSFQFYQAIHKAMERVFCVEQRRSLVGQVGMSLLVMTALAGIAIVSFSLTALIPILPKLLGPALWVHVKGLTPILIRFVLPFLVVFVTVMFLYKIVPRKKISLHDAMWGALFTAVMLEAGKHAFSWYVKTVVNLGTIYGSLSTFMTFLFWVYFSSSVFLVGGEVVQALSREREEVESSG